MARSGGENTHEPRILRASSQEHDTQRKHNAYSQEAEAHCDYDALRVSKSVWNLVVWTAVRGDILVHAGWNWIC